MPMVSVILPTYNCARHVKEAIDSILRQTFRDFELIIVDDGSTDATPQILAEYRDRRMVILRRPENGGLVDALNWGLSFSTAPLIARMDADDVSEPRRLGLQVAFLAHHTDVGLLGTRFAKIEAHGRMAHGRLRSQRYDLSRPLTDGAIRHRMMFYPAICHAAAMFRRSVLDACGGDYRGRNGYPEDYDLFLRMLRVTRMANLSQVLLRVRVSPTSLQANTRTDMLQAHAALATEAAEYFFGRADPELPLVLDRLFLHRSTGTEVDSADAFAAYLRITENFLHASLVSRQEEHEIRRYSALKLLRLLCAEPFSSGRLLRSFRTHQAAERYAAA